MSLHRQHRVIIAPPQAASAELHLYRVRVDAPLYAIGAELRIGGANAPRVRLVARIDPVHAQGFLGEVLQAFSVQAGVGLSKFEVQQERSPGLCPICGKE